MKVWSVFQIALSIVALPAGIGTRDAHWKSHSRIVSLSSKMSQVSTDAANVAQELSAVAEDGSHDLISREELKRKSLEELLDIAISRGITNDRNLDVMRGFIANGDFSEEHYHRVWVDRLSQDHELRDRPMHESLLATVSRLQEGDAQLLILELASLAGLFVLMCAYAIYFFTSGGNKKMFQGQALKKVDGSIGEARIRQAALRRTVHSMQVDVMEIEFSSKVVGAKLSTAAACGELGIDDATAITHRQAFGENKMTPPEKTHPLILLIKQVFGGLFNILLWICVVCEFFLFVFMDGDDLVTPIVLSGVIVASAVLQWWTEQRAASMMDALQKMQVAENVTVYRRNANVFGSSELSLGAEELLPGDVLLLEAGQRVPADIRILDCTDGALVENSAITGESVAEPRSSSPSPESQPLIESRNILFSGTSVVQGRILGLVYSTGDHTLLGQIAAKIKTSRTRSSLEIQIEHFVHIIAFVAISVGVFSLVANIISPRKRTMASILENAATAFFAQVPEGLLPTVTVCLMIASKKMAKRQVLVRKIDAVETLGCVNVLCSDKTGTLTSGEMTATDMVVPDGDSLRVLSVSEAIDDAGCPEVAKLATCGVLNSTAKVSAPGEFSGSPTEVAILTGCYKVLDKEARHIRTYNPQVFEIPFNSGTKWMLTIHSSERDGKTGFRVLLKGAPERVMAMCSLPSHQLAEAELTLETLMSQGKRVLCFAEKFLTDIPADYVFEGTGPDDANFPMDSFHLCGLVALEDPPKKGVPDAIEKVRRAGGVTIMVTGDHPSTAKAIAKRIGIIQPNAEDGRSEEEVAEAYRVVTGATLEKQLPANDTFDPVTLSMSADEVPELCLFWQRCVKYTRVFARVSPMHKRTIVRAYQHFGNAIVAMTGDGVNDAPALKEAEVGVAMGIRGTEVAKEAADIVLLDDDLQSVVAGMEQGRVCSENLRKSIMYTLCSKIPQVLPTFAELFGVPTALTAALVLLIDIGTDIWTAIAYAFQPAESALMEDPPRHPKEDRMVNGRVLLYSYCYVGLIQAFICWMTFFSMPRMYELYRLDKHPTEYTGSEIEADYAGMTMYYWTLVLGQVGAAVATTTTRQSVFTYGLPNKWLNWCLICEILLAFVVIYWSPFESVLKTRPLGFFQILSASAGFFAIFFVEEFRKWHIRSQENGQIEKQPRAKAMTSMV